MQRPHIAISFRGTSALAFVLAHTAAAQPPAAPVELAPVEARAVSQTVELTGVAQADRITIVAAETDGPVTTLPVRAGDVVEAGALLAEVRRVRYRLEVDELDATLAAARARHEAAQDEAGRVRQLHAEQVLSDRPRVATEKNEIALAREVRRLEAALARAKDRLGRARVRAPFAGVVTEVYTELGQWLDESDPVARVVDPTLMVVTLPLPERYVVAVKPGDPVVVQFPFADAAPHRGEVRAIIPEATASARTFPLLVDVANPDGAIRSGMSATAEVTVGGERTIVAVPKDALVETPRGKVVWVVEGGAANQRPVEVGAAAGGLVEVVDGLTVGEQVVVRGNERLRPGQAVRAVTGAARGASER